jgi:hypothetical protein
VLAEAEGEVVTKVAGEQVRNGKGEQLTDGEGELLAEGEGEVLADGVAVAVADGEGEVVGDSRTQNRNEPGEQVTSGKNERGDVAVADGEAVVDAGGEAVAVADGEQLRNGVGVVAAEPTPELTTVAVRPRTTAMPANHAVKRTFLPLSTGLLLKTPGLLPALQYDPEWWRPGERIQIFTRYGKFLVSNFTVINVTFYQVMAGRTKAAPGFTSLRGLRGHSRRGASRAGDDRP